VKFFSLHFHHLQFSSYSNSRERNRERVTLGVRGCRTSYRTGIPFTRSFVCCCVIPCHGRRAHTNYSPAPCPAIEKIDIIPIPSNTFPRLQGVVLTVRTELIPRTTLELGILLVLLRPFSCETILRLTQTF